MDWTEMTYDEQRALLSLPDVRRWVARQQFLRSCRRMATSIEAVSEAFREAFVVSPVQQDYTLARGKR
jgi:transcriptional regulator of met regulon